MNPTNAKSLLAVECGSSTTTAILIEHTHSGYRLAASGQAPSTHIPPWNDITLGVQEAIRHIEKYVGRTLLTPRGGWPISPQNADRQGVDGFVTVVSAGEPLRIILAGLTHDISLMSARRAASNTYSHIVSTLALDDPDSGSDDHLKTLHHHLADVILLAGGTNGGATGPVLDMAHIIALALQTATEQSPAIVYAGNDDLRPEMADILGSVSALTSVDNVRPLLNFENIDATRLELENLYIQRKVMSIPGFDKLKNWSQHPAQPTGKSLEKLVSFLGQHHGLNVVGASIGSRSTVICTSSQGQANTTIRSDAGLGQSMVWLLNSISVAQVHRWLPFNITPEELHHQLLNKSLHVNTIPTSPEDLMIEHAVAREILRLVTQQSQEGQPERQWNLVLGGGKPLTGVPHPAHAAMVLLDGLEPWGVTTLVLDRSGTLNMLGAIAGVEPLAAVQLTQHDTFLNLGTVIAPAGQGEPGRTAVKVKLTFADEHTEERNVKFGQLDLIELPAGQKAKAEIKPARQFDIGLGQPGRGASAEVEGGLLGIIIDARGRPLKLPTNDAERQTRLQQWLKTLKVSYAPPVG